MTRTKKPCPGCGEIDARRGADEVCSKCEKALTEAKAIRKAWADDLKRGGEFQYFRFSATPHWNRGYYGLGLDNDESRDDLSRAFTDAVQCLSGNVPKVPSPYGYGLRPVAQDTRKYEHGDPILLSYGKRDKVEFSDERVRFTEEQAIALRRLDTAIRTAIKDAHDDGFAEGQNLVARLARGDVSVTEYVDQVAEK